MRIGKLNPVNSYKSASNDKNIKMTAGEKRTCDRVEVSCKPADIQISANKIIKKLAKRQTDPQKLESIRQRIKQNSYFVDTDEIVNSMLKQVL